LRDKDNTKGPLRTNTIVREDWIPPTPRRKTDPSSRPSPSRLRGAPKRRFGAAAAAGALKKF